MHLALIINSLGIGGAERVLVRLAHEWADRGYQISFITFFQENNFCYQLNTKHNNIKLINLGEKKPKANTNFFVQIFIVAKRIFLLKKLFNKLQPNLLISFLFKVNISVLLANIWSKIPIIVSERIDPSKHVIPAFYKKLRLMSYRLASNIIVQTKAIKDYFPNYLQKKIFIIPNWVKAPQTKKQLDINNSITTSISKIIAIGRLDQQKNHQLLIRAFAKLADNYPNLTLTIYGEGILRDFLQELIMSLKLQDRIFLPGITMDVEATLAKADLFVLPSIYEGFSNALCEAMAVGLPVIAAKCSGNVDIIEHRKNGLLFNINNTEELVECIEFVINNPEHSNKLAINAQNIINQFNELNILKLWDQALENVLRENNSYVNMRHLRRDGREA